MKQKWLIKGIVFFIIAISSKIAVADEMDLIINRSIKDPERSEINSNRDKYRHPVKTLKFFGFKPDMTVIEIWPGKGWYTEIIAPTLKQGGGRMIAAGFPQHAGPQWRQTMQLDYQKWLTNRPEAFDQVQVIELGPPSFWQLGEDESVDMVLTFRNVHNWLKGGYTDEIFTAMFNVLKSGGILGITDHRAIVGTDLEIMKKSGYLTESLVIKLAEKAGFIFEAASDINTNQLDDTQHPKGVWTLPPTLRLGGQDKGKYLSIGESDRMTLRFRKP
ncbi:MAG: methyltransferase [Gammaproteobacteria bacterium]|nr:MAG: methyltransferase [Gammaproteobacteria bacterium]